MKLKRLKLENFRQHRDSTIEFADGMTAIVGPNGSGKTTVLESITFALYGKQRAKRDSLRFYWAEPRSKCRVTLDFEFDGREYVLERSERDASLVDMTEGLAVTKASGISAVDQTVGKLLRLNYDQFKNSFCAEQKGLAFLQFQTDTRKQEQVARMLGLDRLRAAADKARVAASGFRQASSALAQALGDPDQLATNLTGAKREVASCSAAVVDSKKELDQIAALVEPARQQAQQAEAYLSITQKMSVLGERANSLKANVKTTEASLAEAQRDEARFLELKPIGEEFVQVEKELADFAKLKEKWALHQKDGVEIKRARADIARLQKLLEEKAEDVVAPVQAALDTAKERAKQALFALEKAAEEWRAVRQKFASSHAEAVAEKRHAEGALKRADELIARGICPECGQPTSGDFQKGRADLAAKLESAVTKLHAARKEVGDCEAKPKLLQKAEAEAAEVKTQLEKLQLELVKSQKSEAERETLGKELQSRQAQLSALEKEFAATAVAYDASLHEAKQANRAKLSPLNNELIKLSGADLRVKRAKAAHEEAANRVAEAKAEYAKLKEERGSIPITDLDQASAAKANFIAVTEKLNSAKIDHANADNSLKLASRMLQESEERLATYQKSEQQIKEARSLALLNEVAAKEFGNLRTELNSTILPDLEARASDNLALLTNNRYPRLTLDEDFNATVMDDDVRKQVISGGEEDVVALALRLALSELIQERQGRPMSLLILDEVFGSLDQERRQAVLERLHGIKGRFAQVLVISHIEEINQVADQCVFLSFDRENRCTAVGDTPSAADDPGLLLANI